MREFMLEVVDAPIKLTAMDFFNIDYRFLRDVSTNNALKSSY